MAAELVVAPDAEAYGWYKNRRTGLGEEFLSSVDACLEGIRRQPTVYAVFHTSRNPEKWRQRLP